MTKWEMFYTNSKNDEDLVDQISIDVRNKRYVLDTDAPDMVTDGYDENDEPIESNYVSRFVFDIISTKSCIALYTNCTEFDNMFVSLKPNFSNTKLSTINSVCFDK